MQDEEKLLTTIVDLEKMLEVIKEHIPFEELDAMDLYHSLLRQLSELKARAVDIEQNRQFGQFFNENTFFLN